MKLHLSFLVAASIVGNACGLLFLGNNGEGGDFQAGGW